MSLIEKGGVIDEVIQDGYSEKIIDTQDVLELNLVCDQQSDLFIRIKNNPQLNLNVQVLSEASCTVFLWNESQLPIQLNENYEVQKNGVLKIAYGDCHTQEVTRKVNLELKSRGAQAIVKSSILCQTRKENQIQCTSQAPHTSCIMENYSVLTEGGKYMMEAIGSIEKGAFSSKSHQISRALTVKDNQQATITPQLLIEENDVEASHSTSIGQIDENQMVYLQSRGLTRDQVLSLITMGYLLPIASFIDREELKERLITEIESKVKEACWT